MVGLVSKADKMAKRRGKYMNAITDAKMKCVCVCGIRINCAHAFCTPMIMWCGDNDVAYNFCVNILSTNLMMNFRAKFTNKKLWRIIWILSIEILILN